jgi:hypothetical protein
MDLGSSTWLITIKPWDPGKQLPLGFSVPDHPQGLGKGPIKKIKITHKLQASSRVGPPHNEQASSS